jgi:hypothetical protein
MTHPVLALGQAKEVAMLGSLDHVTQELIVSPAVLVEDNGPNPRQQASRAALAARALADRRMVAEVYARTELHRHRLATVSMSVTFL